MLISLSLFCFVYDWRRGVVWVFFSRSWTPVRTVFSFFSFLLIIFYYYYYYWTQYYGHIITTCSATYERFNISYWCFIYCCIHTLNNIIISQQFLINPWQSLYKRSAIAYGSCWVWPEWANIISDRKVVWDFFLEIWCLYNVLGWHNIL